MVQRFEDLLGLGDHHCIVQVVFVTVECAVGSSIQVHVHQDLRATLLSHETPSKKKVVTVHFCYVFFALSHVLVPGSRRW